MSEQENRLAQPSATATRVARMLLLEQAARFVGGQDELAAALGIQTRSLRAKFSADRGVSDDDLRAAADAMDARAALIAAKAAKMRELIA